MGATPADEANAALSRWVGDRVVSSVFNVGKPCHGYEADKNTARACPETARAAAGARQRPHGTLRLGYDRPVGLKVGRAFRADAQHPAVRA